ncbi:MAG: hypothetical protein NZL93_00510, partial [Chthoniobacterales bacterium]|nr:hypothetical protein [Chthoniobacterales bacterium]
ESFLSKIRMVRNPEAIEKWRQEQSVREEFVFIRNPRVKKSDSENKPDASLVTPPSNESLPADNSQDNPPEPQQPKQTQINSDDFHKPATNTAENPSPSVATEVPTAQSASTSPENSSAPQVTQPSETESNASSPSADTSANSSLDDKVGEIRLKSYLEVRNHYRTNIFSRVCEQVREKVTIRGTAAERSDESIHKAVRAAWLNLVRFPLPLAVSLGHALSARGVQLFKAHENISYCAATRPRFLDRSAYPVSDGVSKILDYIEANPDVPRHEQWKALLTVRASVLTPDLPAEQQIESSGIEATLASELAWLLREGFIIDFAKKGFQISSTAVKNLNQKNKEKKPDEKQPDTPAEAKLEAKSNQKQPTSIPLTANQPNLSESPPSLQESPQLEETCETLCESSVEAPRAQEPTAIPDSNNLPQTTDSIPTKEDIVGDITNAPSSKTSSSRTEVSESATEFKTSSAHSGELQPPPANQ